MTPSDYSKFGGFFDKVIRDYHGDETGKKKYITDWDVAGKSIFKHLPLFLHLLIHRRLSCCHYTDSDYDVKKLWPGRAFDAC